MKRVFLYTRVSTDEQADRGYSLRDQEERLRTYCAREGLTVIDHFQDDHSAKTFDRPSWNRMLQRVEAEPSAVDAIFVVKWDRFSRDATGALTMIRRLEGLGVAVQAIEQPIDRSVPEQLMMLAIYVAAPEVENQRRSLATKQGMRRAMREGRYVNVPPKGYRRGYDEHGRYLIVPGDDAEFVREAFRRAADSGLSMEAIRKKLWKQGFRCSRNQFTLMLRNPLYAGQLVIPAWRSEPEQVVEGLHEPLVDPATYDRVQQRFEKTTHVRRRLIPELPLRGHLLCPLTEERLTGSGSRSRHGYRVWYYHGRGKGAFRLNADEAHGVFEDYLNTVQLAPEVVRLYQAVAREMQENEGKTQARRIRAAGEEVEKIEARLLAVDERFLEGDLERDSYQRLKDKYSRELSVARVRMREFQEDRVGMARRLRFVADLLGRLGEVWRKTSVEARDLLVGSIWPAGLVIEDRACRTPEESSLIALFGGKTQKSKDASLIYEAGVLCGSPGKSLFEPERRLQIVQIHRRQHLWAA